MKKRFKMILAAFGKNNYFIQKKYRWLQIQKQKLLYHRYNKASVDKRLVLLECFRGKGVSCSPKALYEAMLRDPDYSGFRFVWAVNDVDEFKGLTNNKNTIVIKHSTSEYNKFLSCSGVLIFNTAAPRFVKLKKDQIFIQTWHGTPLKRLGCDINVDGNATEKRKDIHTQYKIDGEKFTYLLSPSKYVTEKLCSAFDIPPERKHNMIIEEGYPRNDSLFGFPKEQVQDCKLALGIPLDKNVILYAPTFRDNNYRFMEGFQYQFALDFDQLRKDIGQDSVLLIRTHYFINNLHDYNSYQGFVFDVSKYNDINDLYRISDLLITDYSSVFFDYANLKRPIIFYMYDLEAYQNEIRNFYLNPTELPGPVTYTQKELTEAIVHKLVHFEFDEKYRSFHDKFNYLDDGHAAQRVLDRFRPLFIERTKKA